MKKSISEATDLSNCHAICSDGVCIMTDDSFIKATGVSVRYGDRVVLTDVDFSAMSCSITALIGPSGCGKTTFLTAINRLTDLNSSCKVSGSIKVGGKDVFDRSTNLINLRKKVGMIFQKPNPFPMSIWKNISLPLQQHGVNDKSTISKTIEHVLTEVGLWEEVKDRLHSAALSLSGGQQQRLCIARAIALKPDVILFDEPCSALDPISSGCVEELIHSLRNNYTVIIVTHNLAQARRISDRTGVFWVKDSIGQLVEIGSTEQIFLQPKQPQTAAYISGKKG